MTDPPVLAHLINGGSRAARTDCFDYVYNPSTGAIIAKVPLAEEPDVDEAVEAAAAALGEWRATPVVERARIMFQYRDCLEREFEELARLVTRENGKTLAESRAEVRRGIEVVEFACGIPSLIMGRSLHNIAAEVDANVMRHPIGVCVGITPYNFPAMVPMWMFPIALVCGNTFVLKPSEKVPLSALRLGELLLESGLPAGVFNVLLGGRQCVEQMIAHPEVQGISFVGSTPAAQQIYQQASLHGKRVQAAGGAKNFCVILPDANLELAVNALNAASFGCGGQRCMATSIAVPVGPCADELVDRLVETAGSLRVGATEAADNVDMGPLIRREHVTKVSACLDDAQASGAAVVLDGRRQFDAPGFLLGPSIVDQVTQTMPIASTEVFGPLLSVMRASSLDEAIQLGESSEYGNGASIFTRDGYAARRFRDQFNAGMIGINVGVPAPMAWFPFTGWNRSFFGDLHVQGLEGIDFFTRKKVTMTRWWKSEEDDHHDPIWKS